MNRKVKAFMDAAVPCGQSTGKSIRSMEVDPYVYHVIRYPLFRDTTIRVVTRRRRVIP